MGGVVGHYRITYLIISIVVLKMVYPHHFYFIFKITIVIQHTWLLLKFERVFIHNFMISVNQTKKVEIPAKGFVNITLLGIIFIIYFVP